MEDVSVKVGDWHRPVSTPAVVAALAATVTYRLEPKGIGSRFPVLVHQLFAGRLEPAEAPAALAELGQVAPELGRLQADRLVASLQELEKFDPRGQPLALGGRNAAELLVGRDGRPILFLLQEAVQECQRQGLPLYLDTATVRQDTRRGLLALVLGAVGAWIAYQFFPQLVVGYPGQVDSGPHPVGAPLWAFGVMIAGGGAWELAVARSPALSAALRKNRSLSVLVYCGWYLVVLALSIRWSLHR